MRSATGLRLRTTQRVENSLRRASARLHKSAVPRRTFARTRFISICQGGSHALGVGNHGFVPRVGGVRSAGAGPGDPVPANPNALGLARTVEVDTTGGPGFGFEQYKQHDFLVLKEVVLTFDDGPWPVNTRAVLDALAQHCVKAMFFPIGKHALWHPEILKEVAAAGHTVGGHTWSHANLGAQAAARPKRRQDGRAKNEKSIEEIEKGFSAVKLALGAPPAPFFRFPYLKDPKEAVGLSRHAQHRRLLARPRQLRLQDAQARGRREVGDDQARAEGQRHHPDARLPAGDRQGRARPSSPSSRPRATRWCTCAPRRRWQRLPQWDEAAKGEIKGRGAVGDRPTSSVIRTIEEAPAQPVAAGRTRSGEEIALP